MNIDKRIIAELEKKNKKIASIFSKINDVQEEELSIILEEIRKLKSEKKKVVKKTESVFSVEKKLLNSFQSFEKLVTKKETFDFKKQTFSSIIPNNFFSQFTQKQSKQDYSRKNEVNLEQEKLDWMKRISKKLDFEWKAKAPEIKKEKPEEKSDWISNILSMVSGGAALSSMTKYGKKLMPVAKVAMTLKSLYDLFGTIKSGVNEYKSFKSAGNDIRANDALFKTAIGGAGNLMNAAAGVLPTPYAVLFMAVGEFLEYTAREHDSIALDKNNEIMVRERKVLEIQDILDKGEKTQILQLRPNGDGTSWEFKNYATDSWEPLIDQNTNKPLSLLRGQSKVQADPIGTKDGIQTYKLQTQSNGLVDLVFHNGVPQIKIGGDYKPISTRQSGGPVKKNQEYLVGEQGPEGIQYDNVKTSQAKNLTKSISNMISDLSVEKMIRKLNIRSEIPFYFFKPTGYTVYSHGPDKVVSDKVVSDEYVISESVIKKALMQKDKMTLDFSSIPRDDKTRSSLFVKQLMTEEGGYTNNKDDKGGKTNFGVTQVALNEYFRTAKTPSPNMPKDIKGITKEQAEEIYYNNFYIARGINKIDDPKLAYAWFVSWVGSFGGASKWSKDKNIQTLDQLMDARKKHFFNIVKKDSTQQKWLDGWLGRDIRMLEMFKTDKPKDITIKTDTSKVSSVKVIKNDDVDENFMINTLVPLMANLVNKEFNIV